MVIFFISTLAVSLVAMVILLAAKHYELTTGRVMFAGARPRMSAFFETTSRWGQKILPALAREQLERLIKLAMANVQRALAQIIVTFEHVLERVLRAVRERTEPAHPYREPSAFLREVADHKKHLLYKRGLKKSPPRDTLQG